MDKEVRLLKGVIWVEEANLCCPECRKTAKNEDLYLVAIKEEGVHHVYLFLICTHCNIYSGIPIIDNAENIKRRIQIEGFAVRCPECGEEIRDRDLSLIAFREENFNYVYLVLSCNQCDIDIATPIVLFSSDFHFG